MGSNLTWGSDFFVSCYGRFFTFPFISFIILISVAYDISISFRYLNIYLKTFLQPLIKMAPIKRLLISGIDKFYYHKKYTSAVRA